MKHEIIKAKRIAKLHEMIKAKRIAKLQGQLKALRHMEHKINDECLFVFGKLEKDGVEMHPDNFPDQKNDLKFGLNKYVKLNGKIKEYLVSEINFVNLLGDHEDDIITGRQELAENLLEQITKWEEE